MGRGLDCAPLHDLQVAGWRMPPQASAAKATSFMFFGMMPGSIGRTARQIHSDADRREAALAESAYWDSAGAKRALKMVYYARRSSDNAARAEVDVSNVCEHLRQSLDHVMSHSQACTKCQLTEPNKHTIVYEKRENGEVVTKQEEDFKEQDQMCGALAGCPDKNDKVRLATMLQECRRMQYGLRQLRLYLVNSWQKAARAKRKGEMAYNAAMNAVMDPTLMVKPQTYYAHFFKKLFKGFTKKCTMDCDWSHGMQTRWPEQTLLTPPRMHRPKAIWGFI
mmetsp:Transcript_22523/g.52421  ORF Transcript_22523/g.52421 Transcript_22523/m.52421 type:complete len:279 (+) Transcript_22523:13-849(+)